MSSNQFVGGEVRKAQQSADREEKEDKVERTGSEVEEITLHEEVDGASYVVLRVPVSQRENSN